MARLPKATERFEMRITPSELSQWKRWARLAKIKVSVLVRAAVKFYGPRAEKKA